jgi:DNA-binding XRE family transcriptional regulator
MTSTTLTATSGFIRPKPAAKPPPKWSRMRPVDATEQGRRVRAARAYAGLSNEELADQVGIGRSTLVKTEAGARQARTWELWAIAEVCEVPREWFTDESASMAVASRLSAEVDAVLPTADEQDQQEPPESETQEEGQ